MEIKRQIIESKTPPGNKEVWWFDTNTESLKRYSRGAWELVPFSDDANNEVPLSDTVIETTYEQAKKLYESGNMVPGVQYKFNYNQKQVINDEIVSIEFPLFVWYDGKSLKCRGQYSIIEGALPSIFTADYSFDPKFIYIKKPSDTGPDPRIIESPEIVKKTLTLPLVLESDKSDTLYSDLKSSGFEFSFDILALCEYENGYFETESLVTIRNAAIFEYTGEPFPGEDENADYLCIVDSKGNYMVIGTNNNRVYVGHDSISTSAGFVYNLYYMLGGGDTIYRSYIIDGATSDRSTLYTINTPIFEQDIDQFPLMYIHHSDQEVTCSNIRYIKQCSEIDESLSQSYPTRILYMMDSPIADVYENN